MVAVMLSGNDDIAQWHYCTPVSVKNTDKRPVNEGLYTVLAAMSMAGSTMVADSEHSGYSRR